MSGSLKFVFMGQKGGSLEAWIHLWYPHAHELDPFISEGT